MYPDQELIRLANHKLALRRRIMIHRAQCMEAAIHLARPLAWADRLLAVWRQISPLARLAAVPLGFLVQRKLFPRRTLLGSLFRWGPAVFAAVRGISSSGKTRDKSA